MHNAQILTDVSRDLRKKLNARVIVPNRKLAFAPKTIIKVFIFPQLDSLTR